MVHEECTRLTSVETASLSLRRRLQLQRQRRCQRMNQRPRAASHPRDCANKTTIKIGQFMLMFSVTFITASHLVEFVSCCQVRADKVNNLTVETSDHGPPSELLSTDLSEDGLTILHEAKDDAVNWSNSAVTTALVK